MRLGFLFIVLCFSMIIISYIVYNINQFMDNSQDLKEINFSNKNCHQISINTTLEDLVKLDNKYLIASQFRPFEAFSFRTYFIQPIPNDNLYLINSKTEEFFPLLIQKFPSDIPFHPHGLDLMKINETDYSLYVINHAVDYNYFGEERIEIFNIKYNSKKKEQPKIFYQKSIVLPPEYFLTINSLAVVNENLFYLSSYSALPIRRNRKEIIPIFAKAKYFIFDYLKQLLIMLNIKRCFVYQYYKGEIAKVPNSQSLFNNGIAFDTKRKFLYVIRTMEKDMNVFDLSESNNDVMKIKFIKTVPLLYLPDNVYYDGDKDLLYVGFAGKFSENQMIREAYKKKGNFDDVIAYSGYEIINPQDEFSINELMVMKNNFRGISSAMKIDKNVYLSSIYTKGIYVCNEKEN